MAIENWAEGVILVDLPSSPKETNELEVLMQALCSRPRCAVVMDFSRLDFISTRAVAHLLTLRLVLTERQQRLILCGVAPPIKELLETLALDDCFEFARDRSAALNRLQVSPDAPEIGKQPLRCGGRGESETLK
jgi:anti-anti-sigma regulatory factor